MSSPLVRPGPGGFLTGRPAVEAAKFIATAAHSGQSDKAGTPYIDHPRAVAALVSEPTWQDEVVAWLHDVVEDTPITLDAIAETFGAEIAADVDALTHRTGEPRDAYYDRVKVRPRALKVKLADIAHNTSPERLDQLAPEVRERLRAKYAHALDVLLP